MIKAFLIIIALTFILTGLICLPMILQHKNRTKFKQLKKTKS